MALQTITRPPTAPTEGEDKSVFNAHASAFVAWMEMHADEMNVLIAQLNTMFASITNITMENKTNKNRIAFLFISSYHLSYWFNKSVYITGSQSNQ